MGDRCVTAESKSRIQMQLSSDEIGLRFVRVESRVYWSWQVVRRSRDVVALLTQARAGVSLSISGDSRTRPLAPACAAHGCTGDVKNAEQMRSSER